MRDEITRLVNAAEGVARAAGASLVVHIHDPAVGSKGTGPGAIYMVRTNGRPANGLDDEHGSCRAVRATQKTLGIKDFPGPAWMDTGGFDGPGSYAVFDQGQFLCGLALQLSGMTEEVLGTLAHRLEVEAPPLDIRSHVLDELAWRIVQAADYTVQVVPPEPYGTGRREKKK